MNVVACPSCSKQLKYNPQQAGKQVRCPACQTVMLLPGAPNPAPPANQPVQPSPVAPQQVPTGGQQTNPLLGQTFDPLAPTNQQSFAQSPAAYPQNYSSSPQAKRTPKKKNGLNPVVLWGSIGGGVLVVVVFMLLFQFNLGVPVLGKIPVPEYFTEVELTDVDKEDVGFVKIYECDAKYVTQLGDWFDEHVPKNGFWQKELTGKSSIKFNEHGHDDFLYLTSNFSDYDLHINVDKVGQNKLTVKFWMLNPAWAD